MMPESAGDERRAGDYLTAGHVDGALLVSLHEADQLPVRLTAARVPIVLVGRPPKGSRVSYVDADNHRAPSRPSGISSSPAGGSSRRSPASSIRHQASIADRDTATR